MEAGRLEGYERILTSYKNRSQRVLIITQGNFYYSALVIEVYPDSVMFADKFGKEILLAFSEIKQIGGSGNGS